MHLQLRGSLRRIVAAATLATAAIALPIAAATPSYANSVITATSVALNAGASCSNASLDLGFTSGTVSTETGHSTNLAEETLGDFSQSSGLSDQTTGHTGYGIGITPDQPDGTVIGTYASIGVDPPTAVNTAEFFVLYRCHTDGTQQFLYSCYGDYGGCPKTAATAVLRMDPTIAVSPSPAAAGSTVTVSGNCFGSLAVVTLGASADASDTFAISPDLTPVQGAYETTFALADAPSTVVATLTCGDPDVVTGTASTTFSITPAPTTTTTATTPTTTAPAAAAAAVQTTATFTG